VNASILEAFPIGIEVVNGPESLHASGHSEWTGESRGTQYESQTTAQVPRSKVLPRLRHVLDSSIFVDGHEFSYSENF
jgi:hypothetical protein